MKPEGLTTASLLFPSGMPKLMCPPLTHFRGPMIVDEHRMSAHFEAMAPYVGLFLVPGSTGDGWIMSDDLMLEVIKLNCKNAIKNDVGILAAVLKPTLCLMLSGIEKILELVERETGRRDAKGFLDFGLKGITVCAPSGETIAQSDILEALRKVLDVGVPTALYQLPQITKNEITPETMRELFAHYPNLYLFKDTSGTDAIALSKQLPQTLFMVRGAEGQYASWYKSNGGYYDGFLLSSANGFSSILARIIELSDSGDTHSASQLSKRLEETIEELFILASAIPISNAFANSARIADHMQAYGESWKSAPPPILPDGRPMNAEILALGAQLIEKAGFMPAKGYLI